METVSDFWCNTLNVVSIASSMYVGKARLLGAATLSIAKVADDRFVAWNGTEILRKNGHGLMFIDGQFRRVGSFETKGMKGRTYYGR